MEQWLLKKSLPTQKADQIDVCEGGLSKGHTSSTEKHKEPDLASIRHQKYQVDILQYGTTCPAKTEVFVRVTGMNPCGEACVCKSYSVPFACTCICFWHIRTLQINTGKREEKIFLKILNENKMVA